MTMNDTPGAMAGFEQDQTQLPGYMAPRRMSIVALLSLISSLILCIPVITQLLGIIFGILGIVIIVRKPEQRKGLGLAVAGMVISVLVLAGYALLVIAMSQYFKYFPITSNQFFANLQSGNITETRAWMDASTSQAVTDDELSALTGRLTTDYGKFQNAEFDWSFQGYQILNQSTGSKQFNNKIPLSFTLHFDRSTVHTLIIFNENVNAANINTMFLIDRIYFIPPNGKVWQFPAVTINPPPANPATPTNQLPDTKNNPPQKNPDSGG